MKITLTQGLEATLDDADAVLVGDYKWHAHRSGPDRRAYAATWDGERIVLMHRMLMSPPIGMEVDHVNGDGLDNRRANLRLATHRQNMANRRVAKHSKLGIKGVSFDARRNVYSVALRKDGVKYKTTVKDLSLAIKIRDALGLTLHGEFWRSA